MIKTFEELNNWIVYESTPTTQIALDAFDEFCSSPSREKARKYWAMMGADHPVLWDGVFGLTSDEHR